MSESSDNHQSEFRCENCGAAIEFKPGSDSLACPYCGHENHIKRSRERIEELDYRAYLKSAMNDEDMQETQTVTCGACGAVIDLGENVTSDECPFCGTHIVAESVNRRMLKPKSLLPFKVTKDESHKLFKEWLASRWFAPNSLKRVARLTENLNGIYTPYWTFDS